MEKIFEKVVEIVSENTGLTNNEILTGKRNEQINARAILIYNLSKIGFTDNLISKYTGLSRQGVNKLKKSYHFRSKQNIYLSTVAQQICKQVSNYFAN